MPRIAQLTNWSIASSLAAAACLWGLPTASVQSQDRDYSYGQQYNDRPDEDRTRGPRFRDEDDRASQQDRRDSDRSYRGYYAAPKDGYDANNHDNYDRSSRESSYDRNRESSSQQSDGQQSQQPAGLGVSAATSRRGVRVLRVMSNSPASEAGLQEGDEILAVNGTSIEDGGGLTQIIRRQEPGSRVRLRIARNGQERTLTATLEPLREALGDRRSSSRQPSQRFYRGMPPWGDDQLIEHVDHLERHIQQLQQELRDLRQMLLQEPGSGRSDRDRTNRRFNNYDDRSGEDSSDNDRRFRNDQRSYDEDQSYNDRRDSRRQDRSR